MKSIHGGDIYSHKIKYDFSANINPLGMPESVKKAIKNSIDICERYPDINCAELRNAVSEYEQTAKENIVFGNGAAELIYKIVRTSSPQKALVIVPAFSEYEKALLDNGCRVKYYCLEEKSNFTLTKDILNEINDIDMMFLCNPNNPVGNLAEPEILHSVVNKCSEKRIRLVVDECFMSFAENSEMYRLKADCDSLVILKAFTKIFAMPGLRLGYLMCGDTEYCRKLENCGQCWNVSSIAQAAGAAALTEKGYIEKTVAYISAERVFLTDNLKRLGFKVYSTNVNFILFRTEIPLDKILLLEEILIRNCSNFTNLSYGYYRIAVRTHRENLILINAIERVVNNGKVHYDTGNDV